MKIMLVIPAADHLRVTKDRPRATRRAMLRFGASSIATVAALTPPEHTVTLCDENVEALDFDANVDVVGVTFMTGLAPRAFEIAAEFRRRGKVTVAGGFFPSLCPEQVTPHFDIVVAGEAEAVWAHVLADIERGTFRPLYRGGAADDLSDVPIPRRDLLATKSRHYATTFGVQTGRGCQHACRFCSIAAFFGGRHRSRPLAHVLEEVRRAPRGFMFIDDNIIADPEYAKALFRAMAPMKKLWISQCSLELADDPELLRLAHEAGCRGVFIGIETVSAENLAAVEKGFNDSKGYLEKLRRIRRAGIGVQAGMIVGMDGDDVTVFERTLRFLQAARIDALQLAVLTPQPGTPLHGDFERAGRIVDRDLRHYDFRHVVIRPKRMTPRELQAGADWLYAQYYRLDRVLWRFVRSVPTVGLVPAWLSLKLGLTYRYDNRHEGIVGHNPAQAARTAEARRRRETTVPA